MDHKFTPQILYVEDDETLGFVTRDNLEQHGYGVSHFTNGQSVLDALPMVSFDLAILDVMLPLIDGFAIAAAIRAVNQEVPILFLTAKSLKEDRLKGFKLGADDYITKPYSIEELLFRINVFLRRSKVVVSRNPSSLQIGHFTLDHDNLQLIMPDAEKVLTQKEADLLKYLILQKNQLCKRSDILEKIWGEDDYFMGRSLDVFISRLRKLLATDLSVQLENIHGVGFKLKTNG
ncbi:MAG: response regulator transcription factor [Saprospiraceae bacterium]|nr:response regulator transcription factor [Saprospiraceae bacterium]